MPGTRWLFYVVFDILYAEGDSKAAQQVEQQEETGEDVIGEIVRDAARASRVPCAPGTKLKGGNLTVGRMKGRVVLVGYRPSK